MLWKWYIINIYIYYIINDIIYNINLKLMLFLYNMADGIGTCSKRGGADEWRQADAAINAAVLCSRLSADGSVCLVISGLFVELSSGKTGCFWHVYLTLLVFLSVSILHVGLFSVMSIVQMWELCGAVCVYLDSCLFYRSMFLRSPFLKRVSMEDHGNEILVGSNFSQRDAFREAWFSNLGFVSWR